MMHDSSTHNRVKHRSDRMRRVTVSILVSVAVVLIIGVIANREGYFKVYVVTSASMEPNLHCANEQGCRSTRADRIITSSIPYLVSDPKRGDIVIIKLREERHACSGSIIVKRIVALPREEIEQRRGRIWVNGRKMQERYLPANAVRKRDISKRRLDANQYFVMGDNRDHSCDSEDFGPVKRDEIIAKVLTSL